MSESRRPVFIVGMNGSGTTMMLNCLNGHDKLYGFPRETLVIPHYMNRMKGYGQFPEPEAFYSVWSDFANEAAFRWENGGTPPPVPANWREMAISLATIVEQTYGYFARQNGKERWCEKTPMHAQHIEALHELFPDAYFIHMIRDGRSCAASFHRRWGYIPERTIFRWKNVVATARMQAKKCGARYTEVFYEQLTERPEEEMRRVCKFLDVEFDKAVLSVSRKPGHSGSSANTIVRSTPRWKTYFNKRQLAALERIAGGTLAELGYECECGDADHDPSFLSLRIWWLRDYTRGAVRVLGEEISGSKSMRNAKLGEKIRRAILQRMSSRY